MGLTYHYKLHAPEERKASELEIFLRNVEIDAKKLGFEPTMVLDAPFDTAERREFARRLTHGLLLQNDLLRSICLDEGHVWHLDFQNGSCRVVPQRGVVLFVSDEEGRETNFGFFKYPGRLRDEKGRRVIDTGAGAGWEFEDFIKTPDCRFREIVRRFAAEGYVKEEKDDFGKDRLHW